VEIASIRVSCGCVTAHAPRQVLEPGERTAIQVELDARRFSGAKTSKIYVHFDRPSIAETCLSVRAESPDDASDPTLQKPATPETESKRLQAERRLKALLKEAEELRRQLGQGDRH
jgi:hypothetical protein